MLALSEVLHCQLAAGANLMLVFLVVNNLMAQNRKWRRVARAFSTCNCFLKRHIAKGSFSLKIFFKIKEETG
jgi:hypothetical protein